MTFTDVLKRELHYCYLAISRIYDRMETLKIDILGDERLTEEGRFAICRVANKRNMKIMERMFHHNNITAKAVYKDEERLNPLLLLQHLIEAESQHEPDRAIYVDEWRDEAEEELYCIKQIARSLLESFDIIANDLLKPQGRSQRVLRMIKKAIKNRRLLKDLITRCDEGVHAVTQ